MQEDDKLTVSNFSREQENTFFFYTYYVTSQILNLFV